MVLGTWESLPSVWCEKDATNSYRGFMASGGGTVNIFSFNSLEINKNQCIVKEAAPDAFPNAKFGDGSATIGDIKTGIFIAM